MKIVSRNTAVELGLPRYFTGKPCKRGHIAERLTCCYNCIECDRLRVRPDPFKKEREKRYQKDRKERDLNFRLASNIRSRICNALRRGRPRSAIESLGCSIDELKNWIETQFQNGMSWNNWGRDTWHIDHIKPLASFDLTDPKQFDEATHYSNLQPLWSADNYAKNRRRAFHG